MSDGLQPKRLVSYLFILIIALVFTLQFGPGSRGCEAPLSSTSTAAAKVNGREIPLREYNRAYYFQMEALRAQNAGFTEEIAKQLGIPRQILDRMVEAELLAQAAAQRGIAPADEELRELIVKNRDFQKDGKFDAERYRQILNDFYRKTAPEFEEDLRRQLAAQKMLEIVESGAVVSEEEVKTRFFREGNEADVTFTRFLPAMFAGKVPEPKPDALATYAQQKQKEIADAYQANLYLYQKPERIKARHILVKVASDGGTPDEARAKLVALKKELEAGKDFAQAARELSEDVGTKSAGGDLGWVERASLPSELAQVAFGLEPGKLSDPVVTPLGVHLIRVEEKKAPETRPIKEVELELARQLYVKERAAALARAEADKALAWAKAGKKLADKYPPEKGAESAGARMEQESRPEAIATGAFSAVGDAVPHLGPAPELSKAIFARNAPGPLDQVYSVGEGFVVAVVSERKIPTDADYAQKKETLTSDARWAKRAELREAFLKALRQKAEIVTNNELVGPPTPANPS